MEYTLLREFHDSVRHNLKCTHLLRRLAPLHPMSAQLTFLHNRNNSFNLFLTRLIKSICRN